MKKIITLAILMIILGITIDNNETILKKINYFFNGNRDVVLGEKNQYYRDVDFEFVQNTENLILKLYDIWGIDL